MKKNLLFSMVAITISTIVNAQNNTGVNTTNPQGVLHIDGAKDNPGTGSPNTIQQANDVVVTSTGNVGIGTTTPQAKLDITTTTAGGGLRLQDGTQAAGKVLVADNNGDASWQYPSNALANYPIQEIGRLPVGAHCPAGGNYSTTPITLPAGIYIYEHYSCAGQLGVVSGTSGATGFEVYIDIVSGSGDSTFTWHDFVTGGTNNCGTYHTGVLRVYTQSTIRKRYRSYQNTSFTVPSSLNAENTRFIKIL